MIKITGVLLVFAVCAAFGMLKSMSLWKRVRQLESVRGAIARISTEIRYFATPTDALMEKMDTLEEFHELKIFGLCHKNLPAFGNFNQAWESAIQQAKPYLSLNDGDRETLLWFGKVLGTTDVQGETANCERFDALLSRRVELARDEQKKKGRMYSSLGVLAGVFLTVLLW
jgi:stage III sporulation protein AB